MSKCIKCDVCGRTTPEVSINISKRPTGWFKYWFDSVGGSWEKQDVCDYCWNEYKNFISIRINAKSEITIRMTN
jgi:Fe-S-cluster-containing hydrogenase component 2